jgi:hypothetical protein
MQYAFLVEYEMSLVRFFDFKLYLGPGVLRHLGSADPASLGYYVLNSLGEVGLNAGFFLLLFFQFSILSFVLFCFLE